MSPKVAVGPQVNFEVIILPSILEHLCMSMLVFLPSLCLEIGIQNISFSGKNVFCFLENLSFSNDI